MHFNSLKGWLDWQETLHPKSIDLGLKRVTQVFNRLIPNGVNTVTITVGGTNGKGSSIAFLESIYRVQGLRVGTYTSPHIIHYNERIKIAGKPVSDELICASFERIEAVRDDISLSYFEFNTLAALDIFSRADVDIQLLEVGLGGRLDAVNIVDADATIISSISIDHIAWLGETREAIAYEKAGIFRQHMPAMIGDPNPPDTLTEYANKIQTPLRRIGYEFNYQFNAQTWAWSSTNTHLDALPTLPLKGEHQYRNASAVLATIEVLQSKIPVSESSIRQGLSQATLLGRFQFISSEPPVLLDVSHNPQAADALSDYLQKAFQQQPIHAIFTMMSDKDLNAVISRLRTLISYWYISPLDNPRTSKEVDILEAFSHNGINTVNSGYKDFIAAFQAAKISAQNDNGLILIFGSFFLVSEYLTLFNQSLESNTLGV